LAKLIGMLELMDLLKALSGKWSFKW